MKKAARRMLQVAIPLALHSHLPELQRFVDAMIYKLGKNAHKGKWEDLDFKGARKHLAEELQELDEAAFDGNMVEITLEAADVANFALILASIAIRDAAKMEDKK